MQKWSEKQDQQLKRIVIKYGTNDWNLVGKHFKNKRSRDSIIKRWHGKLKLQGSKQHESVMPEKTKKIQKQIKIPDVKRSRIVVGKSVLQKFRATRSTSFRVLKSNISNNRFLRLSNFFHESKVGKQRRIRTKKEQSKYYQKPLKEINHLESNSRVWSKTDDMKLRSLVIVQGVLDWQKIATSLSCTQDQAIQRWKDQIYDSIKLDDKVGGFLKYSDQEDNILRLGDKSGLSWQDLTSFLPGRSEFSIQARWRRLFRPQSQIQLSKNKHYLMREFLKKIVQKRKTIYQPLEEPLQFQSSQKNS